MPSHHPIALGRLRRAVSDMLAAARRGDCTPELVELRALQSICAERGEYAAILAIDEYIDSIHAQWSHDGRH